MKVYATQKAAFVIAAALMATLPFQNCGKSVQFSSVASEDGKKASFYVNVDDNLVSLPPTSDSSGTDATTPPISGDSGAGPITPPPAPEIADNTDDPPTSEPPTTQLPPDPPATNGGGSSSDQADNHPGTTQPGSSDDQIVSNDDDDDASEDLDDETDGDLNFDHEGKHIGSRCASGAKDALIDVAALQAADDFIRINFTSEANLFTPLARQVTLSNISAKRVGVRAALEVLKSENVTARTMILRSIKIDKVDNSAGKLNHMRLVAHEMGPISNVSGGHLCASARTFGAISNLNLMGGDHKDHGKCAHKGHHHGAAAKIVGRFDNNAPAPIGAVSNLTGGTFLFAHVKGSTMSTVTGRLIIRDSEFDEISNVTGDLILINSTVKKVSNVSGKLVLHKGSKALNLSNASVASKKK